MAAARTVARRRGARVYLAGGAVRDLLLGAPIRDVDLVVVGDAAGFSRDLAERLGAVSRVHERFGTATLRFSNGSALDVAGARSETYPHPGALPTVTAANSIEADLARRDFTVNAMARELYPGRRFFDPFGGLPDLARRRIRVLHPASFCDDPTRAFRAVRYANRLRFRICEATRGEIAAALEAGAFGRISGERLCRELRRIFEEPRRAAALRLLRANALDGVVDVSLRGSARAAAVVRAAEEISVRHPGRTSWLCYLFCWMWPADAAVARRVANRLSLPEPQSRRLRAWPQIRERLTGGPPALRPSGLRQRTAGLDPDEVVAAAAGLGPGAARRALLRYGGLRPGVALRIRGADLRAAGLPAGPVIGRALAATLAARQDGRIAARQELAFALRSAAGEGG